MTRALTLCAVLALATPAFAGDGLGKGETITVSINGSIVSDGSSYTPSLSDDGRFVVFVSTATNLSAPPGDGTLQVMIRDRARGTTRLASVNGGTPANDSCPCAVISGNGRYVVFSTDASNFPSANSKRQIYRHDRKSGRIELVSAASNGLPAVADCYPTSLAVSKNGRFVVFSTIANMIGGAANTFTQAWCRDVKKGKTTLVSIASDGGLANNNVFDSRISDDGRLVVFGTNADNLADDGHAGPDVYLRDRKKGTTTLVSVTPAGNSAAAASYSPTISGNGRVVAFVTSGVEFVPGDVSTDPHVVAIDRKSKARRAFHVPLPSGTQACSRLDASRTGRWIVTDVVETNSPADPFDSTCRAFVLDQKAGIVREASVDSNETTRIGSVDAMAVISGNGRFVAFQSDSSHLGADADAKSDVFLRRLD